MTYAIRLHNGLQAKRFDPYFHQERFLALEKALAASSFDIDRLSNVVEHLDYGLMPTEDYAADSQSGEAFIRVTNILSSGDIDLSDVKYIPSLTASQSQKRVKTNDTIMVQCGSTTGKVAIVPAELDGSLYASFCFAIRAKSGTDQRYLFYILGSRLVQEQIRRTWNVVSVRPNTSKPDVEALSILLPPLSIQLEMVAEMESARDSWRRKLEQAEALLAGMDDFVLDKLGITVPDSENRLAYAVTLNQVGKARFDPCFHHPRFRHLLDAAKSTANKPLGDIVRFSTAQLDPAMCDTETFRYIEISGVSRETGEITSNEIPTSEAPSRARMLVRQGDIIISLTRPHHGSISYIDAEFDRCIVSTGFAVIHEYTDSSLLPHYILAVLRSSLGLQQMLQHSSGGNYPAITETELKHILIPIPSLDIQQEVVDELNLRRLQTRRLREEAENEWEAAKARFEARLLGEALAQ
ncbi:MAG: restriction endonuclease subunit S [Armatimonadetes bacterium]|nr:restriction endonuclease subunit S [Armatimonadota bacterium]